MIVICLMSIIVQMVLLCSGSDKQFTNTWSVGLGWNIHNEKFFENVQGISLLKLRASIGNPGNQNFDDYISTRIYSYNTDNMNIFGSSAIVSNLGNRGLEWQKTMDRNIGFDMVIIDNRLRVNFDYFNKKYRSIVGTYRNSLINRT